MIGNMFYFCLYRICIDNWVGGWIVGKIYWVDQKEKDRKVV